MFLTLYFFAFQINLLPLHQETLLMVLFALQYHLTHLAIRWGFLCTLGTTLGTQCVNNTYLNLFYLL